MKSEIVEVFQHRGRTIVIAKIITGSPYLQDFHNGYVSTATKRYLLFFRRQKRYHYKTRFSFRSDEITFTGTLERYQCPDIPSDMFFLGFDSAHYWNEMQPWSREACSVRERAIELADEMIAGDV